ncbi:hypothetical protein M3Y94_00600400 [Aphelenchoides besseyi]|nr:hypothetical protein M3Y94_00600400 [Aphelenchoides besseyi]KAI6222214.1 DUF2012 domain-containing protein [Aphelenchoides besseyi]
MFRIIAVVVLLFVGVLADPPVELTQIPLFSVEGHASLGPEMSSPVNWQANSRVLLDYGKHVGFIKEDGSFVVEGVPSGSYVLEITNVDYIFEPIRVDINSKGKIRARKLNILQPNAVHTLAYPLRLQARQPTKYFRQREQWRATDVLMNPMVIMLLVAFVLMVVTPKLAASDPQLQKELQQGMQMPKMDVPDISEMFANVFGGGGNSGANKKPIGGPRKAKEGPRRQR